MHVNILASNLKKKKIIAMMYIAMLGLPLLLLHLEEDREMQLNVYMLDCCDQNQRMPSTLI